MLFKQDMENISQIMFEWHCFPTVKRKMSQVSCLNSSIQCFHHTIDQKLSIIEPLCELLMYLLSYPKVEDKATERYCMWYGLISTTSKQDFCALLGTLDSRRLHSVIVRDTLFL